MCESWCCAGEAVSRVSWASVRQRLLSLSRGAVACLTGGVLKKWHAAANTRSSCCMMGAYTPVAPTAAVSWAMTSEDAGQVTDINWIWTCITAWTMKVMLQNLNQTFRTPQYCAKKVECSECLCLCKRFILYNMPMMPKQLDLGVRNLLMMLKN